MNSRRSSSCSKGSFSEVHKFKITVAATRTEGDGMERQAETKSDLIAIKNVAVPIVSGRKGKDNRIHSNSHLHWDNDYEVKTGDRIFDYESSNPSTLFDMEREGHCNDSNQLKTKNQATVEDCLSAPDIFFNVRATSSDNAEEIHSDTKNERIFCLHNENPKKRAYVSKKQTSLAEEMNTLRKENGELENRLELQIRVNDEIKKLLIAAVGEDVETRLHLLAEDKHNLAKQLVNTAKSLSTHQEQIEWLANQCEVWRSKFLASSMLVEDLTRMNTQLWRSIDDYKNSLKLLLQDNKKIRSDTLETFLNLNNILRKNEHIVQPVSSCSLDVTRLCASNRHLSRIVLNAKGKCDSDNQIAKNMGCEVNFSVCSSPSEMHAEEMLSQSTTISSKQTVLAYEAVMNGAAIAMSTMTASPCCSHCTGSVSTV